MHPSNTQFKQDHQPENNITRKLLFRVNTSLFWSTKWKGNSSLWPIRPKFFTYDTQSDICDSHTYVELRTLK